MLWTRLRNLSLSEARKGLWCGCPRSQYRLAVVQEVLLEAKLPFQVLYDSIFRALNLLVRGNSGGSAGLLGKSPAGQQHKAVGQLSGR